MCSRSCFLKENGGETRSETRQVLSGSGSPRPRTGQLYVCDSDGAVRTRAGGSGSCGDLRVISTFVLAYSPLRVTVVTLTLQSLI